MVLLPADRSRDSRQFCIILQSKQVTIFLFFVFCHRLLVHSTNIVIVECDENVLSMANYFIDWPSSSMACRRDWNHFASVIIRKYIIFFFSFLVCLRSTQAKNWLRHHLICNENGTETSFEIVNRVQWSFRSWSWLHDSWIVREQLNSEIKRQKQKKLKKSICVDSSRYDSTERSQKKKPTENRKCSAANNSRCFAISERKKNSRQNCVFFFCFCLLCDNDNTNDDANDTNYPNRSIVFFLPFSLFFIVFFLSLQLQFIVFLHFYSFRWPIVFDIFFSFYYFSCSLLICKNGT